MPFLESSGDNVFMAKYKTHNPRMYPLATCLPQFGTRIFNDSADEEAGSPFTIYRLSGESLIHMPCARLTVLPERSAHKFSSVFVTISYLISIKLTTNKNGDKINVRKRDLGTERYLKSTPAAQL